MKRCWLVTLLALSLAAGAAMAQPSREIVGAWTMVSNTTEKDGKTVDNFGPDPKGSAFFDEHGRFAFVIVRGDLPRIASNNRAQASDEEAQAVLKGSIAYFGSYVVNDTDRQIEMRVEGATFPNWTGTLVKRQFAFAGDQMRLINASPSTGAGTGVIVWRRSAAALPR